MLARKRHRNAGFTDVIAYGIVLAAFGFAAGCESSTAPASEGISAVTGMRVRIGDSTLVGVDVGEGGTFVTGTFVAAAGTDLRGLQVTFLDSLRREFRPPSSYTMGLYLMDTTVARAEADGSDGWTCRIRGLRQGGTSIAFGIVCPCTRLQYLSPEIPVAVVP